MSFENQRPIKDIPLPQYRVELKDTRQQPEAEVWLRANGMYRGSRLEHVRLLIRHNENCNSIDQIVFEKPCNRKLGDESRYRYLEYWFYNKNVATLFKLFFG